MNSVNLLYGFNGCDNSAFEEHMFFYAKNIYFEPFKEHIFLSFPA